MEHETITACENICRDFSWLGFFNNWSHAFADIAVVIGVIVAVYQLRQWRVEHIAKRRAEVAQEALVAAYNAIRALQSIRAQPQEQARNAEIWEEKRRRIVHHNEEFNRLQYVQVLLDALIGNSKASEAISVILGARQKIDYALSIMGPEMKRAEHLAEYNMVWAAGSGDTLSGEISGAFETVKNELFPVIRMEKDKT